MSNLLITAFECVLKRRKELLKDMPHDTIKQLCQHLLSSLTQQDTLVRQMYSLIKEKQHQAVDGGSANSVAQLPEDFDQ